jgi:hypothetical protein
MIIKENDMIALQLQLCLFYIPIAASSGCLATWRRLHQTNERLSSSRRGIRSDLHSVIAGMYQPRLTLG